MARPWRIEFAGALYHILSLGNQRQDIFLDDALSFMEFRDIYKPANRRVIRTVSLICEQGRNHGEKSIQQDNTLIERKSRMPHIQGDRG